MYICKTTVTHTQYTPAPIYPSSTFISWYTNIFIDDNKVTFLGRLAFLLISVYYTFLFLYTKFPPWCFLKTLSRPKSVEVESKKNFLHQIFLKILYRSTHIYLYNM
jgi:hypothetical protein